MIKNVGPACAISMSAARDRTGTAVVISADQVLTMLVTDRGSGSVPATSVLTAEMTTTVVLTVTVTLFVAMANVLSDPILTAQPLTQRITA